MFFCFVLFFESLSCGMIRSTQPSSLPVCVARLICRRWRTGVDRFPSVTLATLGPSVPVLYESPRSSVAFWIFVVLWLGFLHQTKLHTPFTSPMHSFTCRMVHLVKCLLICVCLHFTFCRAIHQWVVFASSDTRGQSSWLSEPPGEPLSR